MKITGSATVEYVEHDGCDYERTSCGQWTVRMGESMEPVYDATELEREYKTANFRRIMLRSFDFSDALKLIDEGWNDWASKPHNKKWSQRVEGTPIRNDLTCSIAHAIIAAIKLEVENDK